jgi:hypothetical protein
MGSSWQPLFTAGKLVHGLTRITATVITEPVVL